MKKIFFAAISLLLFASCEKVVDLNLDDKSGDIVIDGAVTDAAGPYYVTVTKSVAFTESNVYPPITDATVVISDNTGQKDTLQYEADGRYKTSHLLGVYGNTYTLTVLAEGQTYTAQSKMPAYVKLDSLRQDSIVFAGDTRYSVVPVFTDPSILGNYYRFLIHINSEMDKTYNLFSDATNNGKENERPLFPTREDEDDEVIKGDTITVEMRCVDNAVYTYYNALAQISGGFGGGVTPANPPSNISNGALGIFSAHTTQTKTHVIK